MSAKKDIERRNYLLRKERCCAFDSREARELQSLLDRYGYPEDDYELYDIPKEVSIDLNDYNTDGYNINDPDELQELLADILSDEYGYCVNDFAYTLMDGINDIVIQDIDWDLD